jgi:hypothetical protein
MDDIGLRPLEYPAERALGAGIGGRWGVATIRLSEDSTYTL